MKTLKAIGDVVASMSIFVAAVAFAANRGALHIYSPVTVVGEQLTPGEYFVHWDGNGPNVDLEIVQSAWRKIFIIN